MVLQSLVHNHPRREIREDLNAMIEKEEVLLDFEERQMAQDALATVLYLPDKYSLTRI